jgi:CcmD family protein
MINALKKSGMIIVLLLLSISTFAQENQPVEMADSLTQSGKIYVVVTVLSVIFIGIIVYLISIDRKISKLEKEIKK